MLDYPPGWTCERTARELKRYLLETLVLREALALAEHLEACEGCTELLVHYRLTITSKSRG